MACPIALVSCEGPRSRLVAIVALLAHCSASTVVAQDADQDNLYARIQQTCPGAIKREQATVEALARRQPPILHVTRPALQHELLLMVERDQAARRAWNLNTDGPDSEAARATGAVDARNQVRLRQILHQEGFPTARMVGYNGVDAAWLLLQHMGNEHTFQKKWLPAVHRLALSGDLNPANYALLVDRVRLGQGKPQLYGSQFKIENGKLIPFPIEDEEHLDQRRAKLNMVPQADYSCVSRVISGVGQ